MSTITFAVLTLSPILTVHAQDASKPDPAAVEKYASFDLQAGGTCYLDEARVDGDDVTLSGWAILSSDAAPPEPVLLQVDVNGSSRRVMANRTERVDVADHFNNDALKMSGFTAVVKQQTGANVKILQAFEGHLYECPDEFPEPKPSKWWEFWKK